MLAVILVWHTANPWSTLGHSTKNKSHWQDLGWNPLSCEQVPWKYLIVSDSRLIFWLFQTLACTTQRWFCRTGGCCCVAAGSLRSSSAPSCLCWTSASTLTVLRMVVPSPAPQTGITGNRCMELALLEGVSTKGVVKGTVIGARKAVARVARKETVRVAGKETVRGTVKARWVRTARQLKASAAAWPPVVLESVIVTLVFLGTHCLLPPTVHLLGFFMPMDWGPFPTERVGLPLCILCCPQKGWRRPILKAAIWLAPSSSSREIFRVPGGATLPPWCRLKVGQKSVVFWSGGRLCVHFVFQLERTIFNSLCCCLGNLELCLFISVQLWLPPPVLSLSSIFRPVGPLCLCVPLLLCVCLYVCMQPFFCLLACTWERLPWYNCTGWLGVKHQFTYLPEREREREHVLFCMFICGLNVSFWSLTLLCMVFGVSFAFCVSFL